MLQSGTIKRMNSVKERNEKKEEFNSVFKQPEPSLTKNKVADPWRTLHLENKYQNWNNSSQLNNRLHLVTDVRQLKLKELQAVRVADSILNLF
ncbi:hypothetical protein HK099_002140 [Clydaea vesicula]|uniref:Uncharacterized protein n=1 Tax=Clydaea vesicula TaxID=447962 RepID=A0AAD5TV62_9FUNG|nr:hypothetical protein HK099_002140 [Clydaea vesicula]